MTAAQAWELKQMIIRKWGGVAPLMRELKELHDQIGQAHEMERLDNLVVMPHGWLLIQAAIAIASGQIQLDDDIARLIDRPPALAPAPGTSGGEGRAA